MELHFVSLIPSKISSSCLGNACSVTRVLMLTCGKVPGMAHPSFPVCSRLSSLMPPSQAQDAGCLLMLQSVLSWEHWGSIPPLGPCWWENWVLLLPLLTI